MGHMNALDRVKRQSKRQRDDEALIEEIVVRTVNLTLKSVAVSLYELYGFHNVRTGRLLQDVLDRVDEYNERYGSAFSEAAMDKLLGDIGINLVLKERKGDTHGKASEGGQLQDRNRRIDGMPDLREDIYPGGVSCLSRVRSAETEASMLLHLHDRGGETK